MKFTSKERKLTTNQKNVSMSLGLADQKKAIELLYSQYSYPIQTCVQELVSNAFDAHRDANKEHVPVKITLPNELNEFYFSVRDYGNSMDDNTIKNVYLQVNASTKSNSNKAIGGFGIGSKTPWAYVDTYILKTFLNGLETQYALVKGRSSVSVVYQGKTAEPNGTEVLFKTKDRDKETFKEAVRRISLCAKVKPIVNANIDLNFKKEYKINNVISLVKDDQLTNGKIFANLGGVLYRISDTFFESKDAPWNHKDNHDRLDRLLRKASRLVINLPIGALMPLQTREGLFTQGEEGQQNKAVLKKVFKYVEEVLESTLDAKEKEVTSPEKAIDYFSDGMLSSRKEFKFGDIYINSTGIGLGIVGEVSTLSRKKSRGWQGERTVKAKKEGMGFLYHTDRELPVYFSDISPNKARLTNRLHQITYSTDVIVLEKDKFKDLAIYELLKRITKAIDIETLPLVKTTSASKGTTIDKTKVVVYDRYGDRRFSYHVGNDRTKYTDEGKTIVVVDKNQNARYSMDIYRKHGMAVWWVASNNIKKLLELDGFLEDGEHLIDFEKLMNETIKFKVHNALRKLERNNIEYIINLANPNKQKLFERVEMGFNLRYNDSGLYEELMEKYGSVINRAVKKAIANRVRVINLVDKAPLAQHIERPSFLKGQARKDLNSYIANNIGKWYNTHAL